MTRTSILCAVVLSSAMTLQPSPPQAPAAGVPLSLAEERARRIHDLRYELRFVIPAEAATPIKGQVTIRFTLEDASRPLALDFPPPVPQGVRANGRPIVLSAAADHLLVDPRDLRKGPNEIAIGFDAGDAALNRNPDFMYTLFVPARARLAFPCFDQPDLKARFSLTLDIPKGWEALANGEESGREAHGGRSDDPFRGNGPAADLSVRVRSGALSD